jgi:hypothetical protein
MFSLVGIVLYIFDVFSDLRLAVLLYLDGHVGYFGLTLGLVLVAYVINVLIILFVNTKDCCDDLIVFIPCLVLNLGLHSCKL